MAVVKNRNELIYQLRMQHSMCVERFAKHIGVSNTAYVDLENGRESPLKKGKKEWTRPALQMAKGLSMLPEDIWPKEALEIEKDKLAKEAYATRNYFQCYDDLKVKTPEDVLMNKELSRQVGKVLKTLRRREEEILKFKFGFHDLSPEEESLTRIASRQGVVTENIRQKVEKAYRKLRHPARSKNLREWVEDVSECNAERNVKNKTPTPPSGGRLGSTYAGVWEGHSYVPYNASHRTWSRAAQDAINRLGGSGDLTPPPTDIGAAPKFEFKTVMRHPNSTVGAIRATTPTRGPSKIDELVEELVRAKRNLSSHPIFKTGEKREALQKRICEIHMEIRRLKGRNQSPSP